MINQLIPNSFFLHGFILGLATYIILTRFKQDG